MTATNSKYTSLDAMIRSREYEGYISDRLGNDLFINDPERADRLHKYAEDGCDGSTHAEVIEDWRDFLNNLTLFDPEIEDDRGDITNEDFATIQAEIDACEAWHQKNGSLDTIIG